MKPENTPYSDWLNERINTLEQERSDARGAIRNIIRTYDLWSEDSYERDAYDDPRLADLSRSIETARSIVKDKT